MLVAVVYKQRWYYLKILDAAQKSLSKYNYL